MTLTTADLVGRAQTGVVDETDDPAPRPKRRTFTAADKLAHLDAYEALPKGSEERGAYLRPEGLYSTHLAEWRKQRDRGVLAGLAPAQRQSLVLGGGDDYELLFTAANENRSAISALGTRLGLPLTRIGRMVAGSGVMLTDGRGKPISHNAASFDHFS